MKYIILIYGGENAWHGMPEAQMQEEHAKWMMYTQDMVAAGVMVAGASLKPIATATTVRVRGGKTGTTDGPFAETKEQLGGYYVIDVPNLDDAVKWAAQCPGALYGSLEIRPLGIITSPDGAVSMQ
ncbi:YciI family protein [Fimbriiglobus ruber]|uniref:PhnB protein n=1 Tax=Fimbriiglobus ruber TaxID=1908690 RepID=A0A225D8N4_9BACT|nr:YciI family protein [Fimbriiglobus ruber]OWK36004.1 PhnB protein [Fimbriiglobus ruber]